MCNWRLGKELFTAIAMVLLILLSMLSLSSSSLSHGIVKSTDNSSSTTAIVQTVDHGYGISLLDHAKTSTSHSDERGVAAYYPDNMHLEAMTDKDMNKAISDFIDQGFNKYFFPMHDFEDEQQLKSMEDLLDGVDNVTSNTHSSDSLKVVAILLPPSEGRNISNYDWKGWVAYFNELKRRHPSSFDGFAIDDFNWISTRKDTQFRRNVDFMLYSHLSQALKEKIGDINFYPVVYFEGLRTNVVVSEYGKYAKSIILVSASYYNVSKLEANLLRFKKMFDNKPIEYIVYPTITYNYTKQGYTSPSDRLVMATLSIATRMADGIIIWHKIGSHVVQDYLRHRDDPKYLQAIHTMEQLQIADEKRMIMLQQER